jgi:hypothetical protein
MSRISSPFHQSTTFAVLWNPPSKPYAPLLVPLWSFRIRVVGSLAHMRRGLIDDNMFKQTVLKVTASGGLVTVKTVHLPALFVVSI